MTDQLLGHWEGGIKVKEILLGRPRANWQPPPPRPGGGAWQRRYEQQRRQPPLDKLKVSRMTGLGLTWLDLVHVPPPTHALPIARPGEPLTQSAARQPCCCFASNRTNRPWPARGEPMRVC